MALVCNCSAPKAEQVREENAISQNTISATESDMVHKAQALIAGLSPKLKEAVMFSFTDKDREEWTYLPSNNRGGARIGEMSPAEQSLAFDLLKTGLSEEGYELVREIMSLEEVLIQKEKQAPDSDYRNPTKYFISIFGTPSDSTPWSWTYEGHHVSLNYSSVSGKLSVTPSFVGSNPAEVDIDFHKGKRVLGEKEDLGRAFMLSLNSDQQEKALISDKAYLEIVTRDESYAEISTFEGLSYQNMEDFQKQAFQALIQLHLKVMDKEIARQQMTKMQKAGLDQFFFAWAGGLERGQKHYYRIHGPTTIMEYDNAQNEGNHAHFVWRDTKNDFGRDLLKEHYEHHQH